MMGHVFHIPQSRPFPHFGTNPFRHPSDCPFVITVELSKAYCAGTERSPGAALLAGSKPA
jgi:hypothetical protein